MIDTGSQVNILKINCLREELEVDETQKINLRGINECLTETIGKISILIELNGENIKTEFHIVSARFPIPKDGILGNEFLSKNNAIVDVANNKLIIQTTSHTLTNFNEAGKISSVKLKPRTETIVGIQIADPLIESKEIYIHKQELVKDVYCSSTVSIVNNGRAIVSMLNISEETKSMSEIDLNKILYDTEYEIYNVESTNDHNERIARLKQIIITDHMDEIEKQSIYEICERYNSIFHLEGDVLTYTNVGTHSIKLKKDQPPIYRRPYRLPHAQQDEIHSQIQKMEENGIIEKSRSPWNSPLLLVQKKMDNSGKQKFRVVVDFRALNEATINEFHPLPNITEILDQLGNSQLFSLLDLSSGFYQILMEKDSRELTAFSTNQGHWHFKRMIQGMKTSPGTFQRVMNSALAGLIGIKCLVYLDDIIVYGKNLYDHNEKLIEVFERLRISNLKLQPDKCNFLKRECVYLGHVITKDGIKPDERKLKAVVEFPIPTTVKNIKSFLGLSGYYRKFINSYSAIAKPLTNLLKKDTSFVWSNECQKSFDTLKAALCSEPVLKYPDFTKTFLLTTDASNKALGAILSQGEIGKDLPICYASRTLNKSEGNYSTTELECLAIIFGVKQFRPYLYGRKFIILSDHRPLTWLFNLKNPLSKLARWRIQLEKYDYEIRYKPGVLNSNVDALTRMYSIQEIKNESYEKFLEKLETQIITNSNVKETIGTVIDSPKEYNIVSEIAKQYNFRTGTNYQLKKQFGNGTILPISKVIGDTPYFKHENRFIIFLVTKNKDRPRATYESIYISLINLKQFCKENNLNKLAMGKLGDHDDLEWEKIRSMLRYIFRETNIEIIICANVEYSEEEKAVILSQFHDSKLGGHLGVNKTTKRIKQQFIWRGMKEDVKKIYKELYVMSG
ncbi:unnamed protein product [Macrosiphum euphorbiae]|uniref:RNA-directed DNA polymerase n=1 Tax=Macrosiphum euphorbiae TaxID=13131 RepID=A0AAV0WHS6_9HEMI|nr:unnamed protein product [Macrosiphum euphorbiae]